jgi:hypothetical protein
MSRHGTIDLDKNIWRPIDSYFEDSLLLYCRGVIFFVKQYSYSIEEDACTNGLF